MLYDPKWETQTETKPINKILLDAANYIEKNGWCQDRMFNPTGGVCALGAIASVTYMPQTRKSESEKDLKKINFEYDRYKKVWNVVEDYLLKTRNYAVLSTWNDEVGRTKEEVINLLREVAKELD